MLYSCTHVAPLGVKGLTGKYILEAVIRAFRGTENKNVFFEKHMMNVIFTDRQSINQPVSYISTVAAIKFLPGPSTKTLITEKNVPINHCFK